MDCSNKNYDKLAGLTRKECSHAEVIRLWLIGGLLQQ